VNGVLGICMGTPGNDVITRTPGDDIILGLGGNDRIFGLGGGDIICGGADDLLIDGPTSSAALATTSSTAPMATTSSMAAMASISSTAVRGPKPPASTASESTTVIREIEDGAIRPYRVQRPDRGRASNRGMRFPPTEVLCNKEGERSPPWASSLEARDVHVVVNRAVGCYCLHHITCEDV